MEFSESKITNGRMSFGLIAVSPLHRCVFVHRRKGKRALEGCIVPTVKYGELLIMIWICEQPGNLFKIKETLTKDIVTF